MMIYEFHAETRLARPVDRVFPFFADAGNLDELTPPWLHFHMVTPEPIEMREGTVIEYRLRLHGIPLRWRTRINLWNPPHEFIDEQIAGPYRLWIHRHTFERRDGGTIAIDRIRYAPLGGALMNLLFVRRDIRRIFAFRTDVLRRRFGSAE